MERLQKYMATAGVASRRQAEVMIGEGRVKVNNKVVTQMGFLVDPEKDIVKVDNKRIQPKATFSYILLNKPAGVITTCKDPKGRKTVLDLLPNRGRLFPVGRLDLETEGLLLLTDDGELANELTHPRYEIAKTYQVEVDGLMNQEKANMFRKGIVLEDGPTKPAKVEVEYFSKEASRFYLTITEGRNRQVRRMCEAIGLNVVYLKRTKMAFLNLSGLSTGDFRKLKKAEVLKLKSLIQRP